MLFVPLYKVARRVYQKISPENSPQKLPCVTDPNEASAIISKAILSSGPQMVARFGSTELNCIVNYLGVKNAQSQNLIPYIKGEGLGWWWNKNVIQNMYNLSGVFPQESRIMEMFSERMLQDIPLVDVLGSWLPNEKLFLNELNNSLFVERELLNPFFSKKPWTLALKGKKVLVIHPFADTILKQYKLRDHLFSFPVLPDFDLITYPCIQSVAGAKTPFENWFEALRFMEDSISKFDFDIALIAGGAYGFPLAAHVKRLGKKAIHVGGSLQLFFGIIGKRWEDPNYNKKYPYYSLINEYWVRPDHSEKPVNSNLVEGSCYW